jgi:spore coat polysaccharide biosynthesis protein SpsF (cytidylyltransferase family)
MTTLSIITTRSASTRLPEKFSKDVDGLPLMVRVYFQSCEASTIDRTVVATVKGDYKVTDLCNKWKILCYEGSENDILDRLYQTALFFKADKIVRLWGDNPLIEPRLIDMAVCLLGNNQDYITVQNKFGIVAATTFEIIKEAWETIKEPKDREWIHTKLSPVRYSIDTEEDLDKVNQWLKLKK